VQYGEATTWEKLKLNLRLLWCKVTRKYTNKNMKLTSICEAANLTSMGNDKKEELKQLLGSKIQKTNQGNTSE